ncbi:glycerol-3-phosphate acyltransferase 2, mitochondrial isoform X3 [Astyanax mexicanus]|uniref:glycerol-3-phosphate acyltransferase 2, mitochondrial isoform X3 n=1 Tax=Astyanax mexicanus TaxID=7994 RepID=UPI0020CB3468|nr:glycerol-3-phosphate acyltransferase 2, mitochondrial isoform X3 [Astyanax mexicanus]
MSLASQEVSRETLTLPQLHQAKPPALSWGVKIRKKLKAPFLGKYRPLVGQCCHQCTPESLGRKLLHNSPSLGFQDLLCVNETHTRYRGWLVRRVCSVLFVLGRKVHSSPAGDRMKGICSGDRVIAVTGLGGQKDVSEEDGSEGLGSVLAVLQTAVRPAVLRLVSWMLLKMFRLMFRSVQVNLNQLAALHRASQLSGPVVYVYIRQSAFDQALICLALFFHNLRVPYSVCPVQVQHGWRRAVLQKLGVILLPRHVDTELQAETDRSYSLTMTSAGILGFVLSLLSGDHRGDVRIHFAQAFSLKEMCDSGKCRVDGRRPLQEILLPTVLHNRMDSLFGQKDISWLLPPNCLLELPQTEREMTIALTLHLMYSVTNSLAVMSTSIVSCLILHKHRRGVRLSVLCRDVCWLLEEVLFRNFDVGFGGSLEGVVYFSLTLLRPHLLQATVPPAGDPVLTAWPDPHSLLALSQQSDLLTHVFIHEAVGACAVSAMLREAAGCGGGEMEFDVALGQEELTEKSLQLTHLLPVGYTIPCQTAHTFALDTVDSLVCCGILVMEEAPHAVPVCDLWKRQGVLSWKVSDDPEQSSDSDCSEPDSRSYKLSQPTQCPELLFFLCSLLSVQLRALCWTIESLHLLPCPMTDSACVTQLHTHLRNRAQLDRVHHECSSIKLVRKAVRTLTDLGVLMEDRQSEGVYLDISPVFLQTENKQKLLQFVSQFLYG